MEDLGAGDDTAGKILEGYMDGNRTVLDGVMNFSSFSPFLWDVLVSCLSVPRGATFVSSCSSHQNAVHFNLVTIFRAGMMLDARPPPPGGEKWGEWICFFLNCT
jgi:hypothetical protein